MIVQKFLPLVVHASLMKVPQLLRPSLFCDVTNRHCGYGPLPCQAEFRVVPLVLCVL